MASRVAGRSQHSRQWLPACPTHRSEWHGSAHCSVSVHTQLSKLYLPAQLSNLAWRRNDGGGWRAGSAVGWPSHAPIISHAPDTATQIRSCSSLSQASLLSPRMVVGATSRCTRCARCEGPGTVAPLGWCRDAPLALAAARSPRALSPCSRTWPCTFHNCRAAMRSG